MLKLAAVALLHAAMVKASLAYLSGHGAVSIFWPPAGLALAAVLLGGRRYALSVFLGSALANASDPNFTLLGAAGLASANTLEALVARWVMSYRGGFSMRLLQLRDFFRLLLLGGFFAAGVGALGGVWVLFMAGAVRGPDFGVNVLHWWMGDSLGVVMITPLLLVWRQGPRTPILSRKALESVLLFLLAFLVGQIVYLGWFGATAGTVVGHYWMFLIVAWIAVRLSLHGVVLVLLMTGVQGLVGSYHGLGIFAGDRLQAPEVNFWFFLLQLSTVGIALAAHFSEHTQLTAQLRRAKNRQDAMLEAIPDLLFEIDLAGRYHKVYTHHPELLVAPPEVLIGSNVRDWLPPAACAVVDAALMHANQQGFSSGHEYFLELPQGGGWFELSASRMVTADSAANQHFIVLSRDITVRKRAEQDLRIAAIAFESQEGMFVASDQHIILRVNHAFTQITGYSAHEVVGVHPRLFRSDEHGEAFYADVFDTVRRTGQWQGETWSRRKNGELISVWGTLTEVRDEQDRVTHYVRTLIDTTHRKREEQRRLEREAQLRETLVREVHHRIKNNLQGVTGVLRQFCEKHPQTADPINQAIGQVQSIAAIHGLQGRSLSGEVLLPELVRAVAGGVQSLWHIGIRVEVGSDVSGCRLAHAEAVPLALVLNELLSNAVKHGGGLGDVSLLLERIVGEFAPLGKVRLTITNSLDASQSDAAASGTAFQSIPSSGLELVAALLPPQGAWLQQTVQGDQFISTLELQPPAMTWKAQER